MTAKGIKNKRTPSVFNVVELEKYVLKQKELIGINELNKIISPFLITKTAFDLYKSTGLEYIFIGGRHDIFIEDKKLTNQLIKDFPFLQENVNNNIEGIMIFDNSFDTLIDVIWGRYKLKLKLNELKKRHDTSKEYNKKISATKSMFKAVEIFYHFLYKALSTTGSVKVQLGIVKYFINNGIIYSSIKLRNQLLEREQILQGIFDKESEAAKETKSPLLIEGKAPNILERYTMANELFDIGGVLSKLNTTSKDKSVLLAQIMGCSKQVARELMNGTYVGRAKIRTETINKYISKIKK